jgi:hypothetical protein
VSETKVVETTILSLQMSFSEVAMRANRLQELMELEPYLVNLRSSFDQFNREVRLIPAPPIDQVTLTRLNYLWSRCNDTDFIDLKSFSNGIRYIDQSLSSDTSTIPMVNEWIDTLLTLSEQIQVNLDNTSLGDLKDNCTKFQRILNGYIADRRMVVISEIKQLCELTFRLKMKLEA